MDIFLSFSPLIILVIGIVFLKISAKWVSVVALIYCFVLVIFYTFNKGANPGAIPVAIPSAWNQSLQGFKQGLQIVFAIWAAFMTMNMLVSSGAMAKIKETIMGITPDKRKVAVIIGLSFGGFLEGVCGAGTPAAICAPFLMSMGFPILDAAAIPLIFNGIAASLGANGLTTRFGFAAYVNLAATDPNFIDVLQVSMVTGFIHFFGAIASCIIVSRLFFGKKALTGEHVIFCVFTGAIYGILLVLIGTFFGPEFATMLAGVLSLVAAVVFCKIKKNDVPDEFRLSSPETSSLNTMSPGRALSTYIIMLILLLAVRLPANYISKWLAFLIGMGFTTWIACVIAVSCVIGAFITNDAKNLPKHAWVSIKSVIGALIAIACLTAVSNMMKVAGMMQIIANALVTVTGPAYPAAAVLIGSLGSFVMGTTMGSNIMFGPVHFPAAHALGIPQSVVFAANNVGGALGNMICPNNVVSCCATINCKEEGKVMTRVFPAICILWALYMILAVLYSYVFFTGLPVK
jgi:lactate permease